MQKAISIYLFLLLRCCLGITDVYGQQTDSLLIINVAQKDTSSNNASLMKLDSAKARLNKKRSSLESLQDSPVRKIQIPKIEWKEPGLPNDKGFYPDKDIIGKPDLDLKSPRIKKPSTRDTTGGDVMEYKNRINDNIQQIDQGKGELERYKGKFKEVRQEFDSLNIENLDTLIIHKGYEKAEKSTRDIILKHGGTELPDGDIKGAYLQGFPSEAPTTEMLNNLDLKKIQQPGFWDKNKLKAGMANIQKEKSRYKSIRDSRFQKEGIKKHSLAPYPLKDRVEVGLGGYIPSFDPFSGVLFGGVGFRIDKRWALGAGPVFSAGNQNKWYPLMRFEGYRAYSLLKIKEALFLQGEYRRTGFNGAKAEFQMKNEHAYLGGIGTEFGLVRNLKIRSTVLYKINKRAVSSGGFESPWQINMGIVNYRK